MLFKIKWEDRLLRTCIFGKLVWTTCFRHKELGKDSMFQLFSQPHLFQQDSSDEVPQKQSSQIRSQNILLGNRFRVEYNLHSYKFASKTLQVKWWNTKVRLLQFQTQGFLNEGKHADCSLKHTAWLLVWHFRNEKALRCYYRTQSLS